MSSSTQRLPKRTEIQPSDTWDLSSLYAREDQWEGDFDRFQSQIPHYEGFRGKLGESPQQLAACLRFDSDLDRLAERVGTALRASGGR